MLSDDMKGEILALRSYAEDAVGDVAQSIISCDHADPRVRAFKRKGLRSYDLQAALADEVFNDTSDMVDLLADRPGDALAGAGAWGSPERKEA